MKRPAMAALIAGSFIALPETAAVAQTVPTDTPVTYTSPAYNNYIPQINIDRYVNPGLIGAPQDIGVMERARPDYDPKGIPLGGFRLFPTLNVQETYDTNVFRLPSAQSDEYLTVAPALRMQSQWGRHFLEVYGGLNYFNYANYTSQDLTDWKGGINGRLDISRAALATLNAFYGEMHELWASPNTIQGFQAQPTRYYQMHADSILAYQPNRLGVSVGGIFNRYDFTKTPAIGGGYLSNSDRNENEYQAFLKVYYDFSPGYSGFVKGSYDGRDFDQKFDRSNLARSSNGYHVDAGVDFQLTHLLRGQVYVGYLQQYFARNVPSPLQNAVGVDYGVELDWFYSPILTAHFKAKRELADVIIDHASIADNKSVELSADYEFRRDVIIQAYASYTNSVYVGTTRIDHYPGAGIGVKYLLNSYANLSLKYDYSNRGSNTSGIEFNDHLVSLELSLQI